ncbi:MAG: flagellar motor switch protein FliG [Gammaproteobacteria bacterium]|nr:flagellar motor switch protein FliG [Gammaproteobacteria bacterium]MDH3768844.1 flagellar motor switch protein FliG [Gammaproteobacteria bacterium]
MSEESLTGTQRAAIFLMSLKEQEAAEILRHMSTDEVQRVGTAMTTLARVSRMQLGEVISEFNDHVGERTSLGVGADEYVRRLLTNALGAKRATSLLDRILQRADGNKLEALEWMETSAIQEMIDGEHPQIIAIVLAHLNGERAAEILNSFDETLRHEVFVRIATLDDIQEAALKELDAVMSQHAEPGVGGKSSSVGGLQVAADILASLGSDTEEKVIEFVNETDGEMGEMIQDLMFSFEMLLQLDDRGMQTLLREISSEILTVALKGADQEIADKIFSNMSKRAAEMLKDDLEVRGPMRLSEVETAQKEIIGVAKRLGDEGTIMLGSSGEEFV